MGYLPLCTINADYYLGALPRAVSFDGTPLRPTIRNSSAAVAVTHLLVAIAGQLCYCQQIFQILLLKEC
uniref:Uncharacterized protein n=1 Tax=Setaria digitata TaxID=48799 RepID=A0A915PR34_9BILA